MTSCVYSEVSVPVVGEGGAVVDERSVSGLYRERSGEGAWGGNGVMGERGRRWWVITC